MGASSLRRALWSFWILLGIAVVSAGAFSAALEANAGPLTGLRVGVSGTILIGSLALAARVIISVERARRRARRETETADQEPAHQLHSDGVNDRA